MPGSLTSIFELNNQIIGIAAANCYTRENHFLCFHDTWNVSFVGVADDAGDILGGVDRYQLLSCITITSGCGFRWLLVIYGMWWWGVDDSAIRWWRLVSLVSP